MRIYHNSRCSKSRGALALLRDRGIEPEIVYYLDEPPSRAELAGLLRKLGIPARALLRKGEDAYRSLGLEDPSLSEETLLEAMVAHPILIERPILVNGERAVIARPPEKVLEIL